MRHLVKPSDACSACALLQKVEAEQQASQATVEAGSAGPSTAGVWKSAAFDHDKDGKMATKFLRLMGVKNAEGKCSDWYCRLSLEFSWLDTQFGF